MFKVLDGFLNRITMYRLVLYELSALLGAAMILGLFGVMSYTIFAILGSVAFLTAICLGTNVILARIYRVPANVESVYITALILALIITPPSSLYDPRYLALAFWAALWAVASKYFFALGKKHIFNPAAFAVALMSVTAVGAASWWVGTFAMLPFVAVGGGLIVRKIRRADLALAFLAAAFAVVIVSTLARGLNLIDSLWRTLVETPIIFFATVMLTEPLTTPPTRRWRLVYGAITGLMFAPQFHLGPMAFTPETALLTGNVFSYLVSPKWKLMLKLKEKTLVGPGTYDFSFTPDRPVTFKPGQYLEWTLPPAHADARGNRRYFTIASSPTEELIHLGVKFPERLSSFKRGLLDLKAGDVITAGSLAGDFTLPEDKSQKLVWIAGGIGITPFRSMTKYLLDRGEKRDVVLFYSCKTTPEFAYNDLFTQAASVGLKTICAVTDLATVPADWAGHRGFLDGPAIAANVPDYRERRFYLSGPHAMVSAFEATLAKLGVPRSQIKTDYFPGFA
jgi:ferredoxin-NADP reductase